MSANAPTIASVTCLLPLAVRPRTGGAWPTLANAFLGFFALIAELFAAMSVIWGIPYLLIKVTVGGVEPPVLVLARVTIGAVSSPWCLMRPRTAATAGFT
jgi:hypothetical protein